MLYAAHTHTHTAALQQSEAHTPRKRNESTESAASILGLVTSAYIIKAAADPPSGCVSGRSSSCWSRVFAPERQQPIPQTLFFQPSHTRAAAIIFTHSSTHTIRVHIYISCSRRCARFINQSCCQMSYCCLNSKLVCLMISILINPPALINSHAGETFGSGPPGGVLMLGLLNASGKQWSLKEKRDAFCAVCRKMKLFALANMIWRVVKLSVSLALDLFDVAGEKSGCASPANMSFLPIIFMC